MRQVLERVAHMWYGGDIDAGEMRGLIKEILRPTPCTFKHKKWRNQGRTFCPDCGRLLTLVVTLPE